MQSVNHNGDGAAAREREPVLVDLALQGGGAHGAYTWGVLDRLLEDDGFTSPRSVAPALEP